MKTIGLALPSLSVAGCIAGNYATLFIEHVMAIGKSDSDSAANGLGPARTKKLEAFLGEGSKVVGNLNFTGPVELDGYIEGELNSQETLVIGESAVVNAKIRGGEIVVKGTVNGDIVATKRLSLKKPARVVGNITSSTLSIEDGVIFEGSCSMSDSRGKTTAVGGADKSADKKVASA